MKKNTSTLSRLISRLINRDESKEQDCSKRDSDVLVI